MITVKDQYFLIDSTYEPAGVEEHFYDAVVQIYLYLADTRMSTPLFDEIEEWMFRRAILLIDGKGDILKKMNQYPLSCYIDDYVNKEILNDYIKDYGKTVRRDIKICLRHAKLCFVDLEFYTHDGNFSVFRNSPQRKIFKIYDIYGNSD